MLRLPVPAGLRRAARRRRRVRHARPARAGRRAEPPVRGRLDDRLRRLPAGRRVPGQQPERHRCLRLRIVLPRRRRRAGLRGLTQTARLILAALTAALLAAVLTGCGSDEKQKTVQAGTPTVATPSAPPPPAADHPRGKLAVGLTETNPNLLWSSEAVPKSPDVFGPWRDRVQ